MTIALTIALILVIATAGTLWWRLYRADQENQKLRDLYFETLKEMTWLMIEMESERRVAVQRMAKALDSLAVWEKEHPVPSSP